MGTYGIQRFVENWLGIIHPAICRNGKNTTDSCCLFDYVEKEIYWSVFGYVQQGAWQILVSNDPNVGQHFQDLTHLEMEDETPMSMIA